MSTLSESYYRNYLVHGLPGESVRQIASLATEEGFIMNETIVKQGEKGSDLYIVLEGTVNIIVGGSDKLNEIGPGSVIGEIALIDDQPRSADAVAKTRVKVARIPAKELRNLMWEQKDVGFVMLANLSRVLCGRLRQASAMIDTLMDAAADPWAGQI
ncbi:MAG TPA: cyclic nucleotide-binding domain-containing protein [Fimbriimonas sp.]